jgi:hypothetical protein
MSDDTPPPRKFSLKAKEFKRDNAPETPAAPGVHEILRQNLAVQKSMEPEVPLNLHDRRTHRRRDYLLVMLSGNTLGALAAVLLHGNVVVLVYLLAFFVIFNLGLYWVMFQVMDKY